MDSYIYMLCCGGNRRGTPTMKGEVFFKIPGHDDKFKHVIFLYRYAYFLQNC